MDLDQEREASRRITSLRPALRFIAPYKKQVLFALLALTVTASATLSVGLGLRFLIDEGFMAGSGELLKSSIFAFAGLMLVLAVGTYTRFYFVSWVGERVSADIRMAVYEHLVRLHPGFFERNAPGEIQTRITTDTTLLQTVIGSSASIALRNMLMFLGGVVLLFATNAKLSALVVISAPLIVLPVMLFGRRVRGLSRASQDTLADVGSHAGESLRSIKLVQAFRHEAQDVAGFLRRVTIAFAMAVRRIRLRAWLIALVMVLVLTAIATMLWIGGQDVLAGRISHGELAAFIFYAFIVAGSVGAISEVWSDLQRAAGAMERLLELLEAASEISDPVEPKAMLERGTVEVSNATFGYPSRPEERVLKDVNLHVRAGEMLALVGPSGAGKSTLFDLLLRFYDVDEGVVRIGGIDVRDLALADLRRSVGIVPQDATLLAGTIRDNVAYGVRHSEVGAEARADDEAIARALKDANADAFVAALPDGMNTRITEGGRGLSGGQRQRLAIARALLADPDILLMDEITSSLDAVSEEAVVGTLHRLRAKRTILIIAHRLSTAAAADRIVVLDGGRVVGEGTHADLLATNALYREFVDIQLTQPDDPQSDDPQLDDEPDIFDGADAVRLTRSG